MQLLRANTYVLVLLGRLPKTKSRYFVAASSMLYSLQDTKHHSRVNFEQSHGVYAAIERLRERDTLILQDLDGKYKE